MFQNMGTFGGGLVGNQMGRPVRLNDAAIANGGAFLVSEIEKRDPLIREPLTAVTYHRDLPMRAGGGWVEFSSAININYAMTDGATGPVAAGGANAIPVIQANLGKDVYKAHVFAALMRIGFVDTQRSGAIGRSLDQMMRDGIRLAYDKHWDTNAYLGLTAYGTTGLVNNANVTAASVDDNGALTPSTAWADKTPDQILKDVNDAITACWAQAEYDLAAIPNHILLPYEQYTYIATTKVGTYNDKTILQFILENNIAKMNGSDLVIGATRFCNGAGAGNTDRMVVYAHDERYLAADEFVPLSNVMTQPNTAAFSYDTVFAANISEVQFFYTATIYYADGI